MALSNKGQRLPVYSAVPGLLYSCVKSWLWYVFGSLPSLGSGPRFQLQLKTWNPWKQEGKSEEGGGLRMKWRIPHIYLEEGANHQNRNVPWAGGNKWLVLTWEERIGKRDLGVIQVKAELKPWKWMCSLKEKPEGKNETSGWAWGSTHSYDAGREKGSR